RRDLTPVFSFNAHAVFVKGSQSAGVDRITRWQDLLARMRQEGFTPGFHMSGLSPMFLTGDILGVRGLVSSMVSFVTTRIISHVFAPPAPDQCHRRHVHHPGGNAVVQPEW